MLANEQKRVGRPLEAGVARRAGSSTGGGAPPVRQFPGGNPYYAPGALGLSVTDSRWEQTKTEFQRLLRNGAPERAKSILDNEFARSRASYDIVDEKVNELRGIINKSRMKNDIRIRAHDMVDGYGTQIGQENIRFLAPSRSASHYQRSNLSETHPLPDTVHRDIMETERIGDVTYVPVYMAVVNSAIDNNNGKPPRFKDFEQDPKTGQVIIHTGDNPEKLNTLWVSFGQAIRQLGWVLKYRKQAEFDGKNDIPLIRSFMLPLNVANKIQNNLVTERDLNRAREQDRDLNWRVSSINVDKEYGGNQAGIDSSRVIHDMRAYALKGSLRTYVPDIATERPKNWGQILSLMALQEKYGFPTSELSGDHEFIQTTKSGGKEERREAQFPKKAKVMQIANDLAGILDIDRRIQNSSRTRQTTREEREKYRNFVRAQTQTSKRKVEPADQATRGLMHQTELAANRAAIFVALAENYQEYLHGNLTDEAVVAAIHPRSQVKNIGRNLTGQEPINKNTRKLFERAYSIDTYAESLKKYLPENKLNAEEKREIGGLLAGADSFRKIKDNELNYGWTIRDIEYIKKNEGKIIDSYKKMKGKLSWLKYRAPAAP